LVLCCDEEFLARVQRYGRVQVPVLIRWKHKLEAGEVLSVYIYFTRKVGSEGFHARMSRDGRFTIPKVVVKELGVEPGDMIKVNLYAQTKQEE
jgi:bifunctional DNA-binding transcriptional regulator/antitoxin component of YhaV-PrlF toxin-antitoxin module